MKEHPILFSAPMIRALLDGTKRQTRRIVKPQPEEGMAIHQPEWFTPSIIDRHGEEQPASTQVFGAYDLDGEWGVRCPYGAPGDRLWVKEGVRRVGDPEGEERWCGSEYIADGSSTLSDCWPWKVKALPGMYMPRGMSRITLAVESVRVDRLHDISEEDARAEGFEAREALHSAVTAFASLWCEINGRESWDANPWVWMICFSRVEVTRG